MTNPASHKGFTLVETLVAISILLLAIMGPMTIAAKGLKSAFFAREQLTAVYLAQEAIEFIRMKRDGYALVNQGSTIDTWLTSSNIANACKSVSSLGCGIDVTNTANPFRTCSTAPDCTLRYNANAITSNIAGMYNHQTGVVSPYTRIVKITGGDDEAMVNVTVTWQSGIGGGTKTVELESYLFNQYDRY